MLIAAVVVPGYAQKTETLNFQVGGTGRSCVIHVPAGLDNPALLFFLHGAGGNGDGFANDTKGNATADREKFIAAYPSGVSGNWDYSSDGSNDFKFIMALIDTIDARYKIDRDRLYVTGFSMGGGLCFALGCRYATVFAAIAPVSASGTECTPDRKIPLLLTFGTKDMRPAATYMEALGRWTAFNGCPATPEVIRPYPKSNAQSVVTRISYGPCGEGTWVVADSVHDGGHGWPTDSRTSVNQADEVWAFCSQFSLKGSTATKQASGAVTRSSMTVSYASGIVSLHGADETCRVQVLDTRGRLVARALTSKFAFNKKSSGVYLFITNGAQGLATYRMVLP